MKLDFIVIGAQKGGTTSLWRYLREHPGLFLPGNKEAPAFTVREVHAEDFTRYMRNQFGDAPAGALLGKVTPDYMVGRRDVGVESVAARIVSFVPEVKLIALLRDPIERAVSSYIMAVRRGQESRSLDAALDDLLGPEEIAKARLGPSPDRSYVVAGEYGRILGAYRAHLPADRLLVTYSEDLSQDPAAVLDSVLSFLGLPAGFRPEGLGLRHFRGGVDKLLDPEAERLLFEFHREEILPHMKGSARKHLSAFEFFYETWNVALEGSRPAPSPQTRVRLESHFRCDAERLAELGVGAPWIAGWDRVSR